MPPHPPDTPDTTHPATWRRRQAAASHDATRGSRWLLLAASTLGIVLLLLLAAALTIPPTLNWGRYRMAIAAIATSQLGRPVVIAGDISLRLLPEAVLTATDVTLPDQGDGVSANLRALRLQVALAPLLAGRIVPHDLVLGTPVLRLPWPLPNSITHPARPSVPHAFAAHMENGTLRVGQADITGINAHIHGGPEPGSAAIGLQETGSLAFGAEGFATFAGRNWRFTSALGAPDADGVSALDLGVMGQGAAARTGATIQGSLAGGVVQGRLVADGPNLSLLMQSAPLDWHLDWHLEAPFVASGEQIRTSAITLSLGGAPVDGSLELGLVAPVRLSGRIHAASLNLDGWVRPFAFRKSQKFVLPHLLGRLDWSLDRAQLLGGTLHDLHGTVTSDGRTLILDRAEALLPGEARASMSGTLTAGQYGPLAEGPATLDAPDLHATLAWLRSLSPNLLSAIPQSALERAKLAGKLSLSAEQLSVSDLVGQIDGVTVAGKFSDAFGARQHLDAALSFENPDLDQWLGQGWPRPAITLASAGQRFASLDSALRVRAANATWHGLTLRDLVCDAQTGPAGLRVNSAEAVLAGTRLTAKGMLGVDGTITDAAVSASTADLASAINTLPAFWRWAPGLWHGAGGMQATASGPPGALAVELRADADDLILESEIQADLPRHKESGTLTLRHPGVPRLLAAFGFAGAERWLDTGSLAVRAHVTVTPNHLSIQDFDLLAADLHLDGKLDLDMSRPEPRLTGNIDSTSLALPNPFADGKTLSLNWLRDWSAVIDVTAAQVTLDRLLLAGSLLAHIDLSGAEGMLDVKSASVSSGHFDGQLAFDARSPILGLAVKGDLTDAKIASPLSGFAADLASADLSLNTSLHSSGNTAALLKAKLWGATHVALGDATLTGFDMAFARRAALQEHSSQSALAKALTQGNTYKLAGAIEVSAANGKLVIAPAQLTSPDGIVSVRGTADLSVNSIDLTFGLAPEGITTQSLGVHLNGPWSEARAQPIFTPLAAKPVHALHRSRKRPVKQH